MGEDTPGLAGLPETGEPVFYPKVGHCIYRGITEDRVAPGTKLLELEDLEEGSRILIPISRVPELNLRAAGTSFEEIQEVLAADFEEPLEDEEERHELVEELIADGSPRALAQSLKRLHLLRQTTGLTREEEQTRKKIRSWLAAEVSISKECTRAEAQAFMTRILQESMAHHRKKEKEEAKERRRAARAQKKAEEAEASGLTEESDDSKNTDQDPELPVDDRPVASSAETSEPGTPSESAEQESVESEHRTEDVQSAPDAGESREDAADGVAPPPSEDDERRRDAADDDERAESAPRVRSDVSPGGAGIARRETEEKGPFG